MKHTENYRKRKEKQNKKHQFSFFFGGNIKWYWSNRKSSPMKIRFNCVKSTFEFCKQGNFAGITDAMEDTIVKSSKMEQSRKIVLKVSPSCLIFIRFSTISFSDAFCFQKLIKVTG